ncbi:MAG: inositol monophosphatase family protein, partial [Pseudomonadota bacterium]
MNLQPLLAPLAEIVRNAGAAILNVYEHADFEIKKKQDNSPLTAADLAAHHIIVDGLTALDPGLPVLSEESISVPWATRKGWSRYWLVDPLDGTKEFIKRNGEFTVNVALIDNGVPVLGIVYVPVLDWLYAGILGEGAWKEVQG